MNYLIYYNGNALFTNWFDFENNYVPGMIVFNLLKHEYTQDGVNWNEIEQDHI